MKAGRLGKSQRNRAKASWPARNGAYSRRLETKLSVRAYLSPIPFDAFTPALFAGPFTQIAVWNTGQGSAIENGEGAAFLRALDEPFLGVSFSKRRPRIRGAARSRGWLRCRTPCGSFCRNSGCCRQSEPEDLGSPPSSSTPDHGRHRFLCLTPFEPCEHPALVGRGEPRLRCNLLEQAVRSAIRTSCLVRTPLGARGAPQCFIASAWPGSRRSVRPAGGPTRPRKLGLFSQRCAPSVFVPPIRVNPTARRVRPAHSGIPGRSTTISWSI
jgi:hypothetical protein